jgi:Zn-dependent M32 family carboxypeptidase
VSWSASWRRPPPTATPPGRRDYAACFDDVDRAYDALLADYDFGVSSKRLETLFARLADSLTPLLADLPADQPDLAAALNVPVEAQQRAVLSTLHRLGANDGGWRIDVSAHPFSEAISRQDTRVTTRGRRLGFTDRCHSRVRSCSL